jgi:hypothetical protein
MGLLVGLMFAAVAGNAMFWIGLGIALGMVLDAAASRAVPAQPGDTGREPSGLYRVR